MIAGGGHIGESLARSIESSFSVKVLEFSAERADAAAQKLNSSVVILGDATDRDLLIQENIERTDAFCAVTNDDEVNIMSSMLAKQLGVRQVMTLIGKPAYVDLMHEGSIDIAISPQLATTSTILTHVRRADVARVHSLRRGAAEAMEAVVHGDDRSSKVVGRRLIDLGLPEGTTIGALVRNNKVLIAHDELQIESEDHVILFLTDKTRIGAVERLFQVNFNFF
jgi:trk system potassium uptake protein TrkA